MQGSALYTMLGLIALTMAMIYLLPKLTKAVPAALVGILVVSGLVVLTGLPSFHLPSVPLNWDTLTIVLPYSLILAAIGRIESLLTLNLIDTMTDTRGKPNHECLAQGTANVVTGFFGGLGGCAMIGQSTINVNHGATKRLSGIATALFLLSFILFGSRLIEQIPLATLIGVMFVVAEKTFEWGSVQALRKISRSDAVMVVVVTIVTVFTDLAIPVVLGVVIAALVLAWEQAEPINVTTYTDDRGWRFMTWKGRCFFASVSGFQRLFTPKDDPDEMVVEFRRACVADHSAIEATACWRRFINYSTNARTSGT